MKDSVTREQANTRAASSTNEISRVAVSAIGVSAGLIGIWAVACVIAGLSSTGGPIELVSSLFKAING